MRTISHVTPQIKIHKNQFKYFHKNLKMFRQNCFWNSQNCSIFSLAFVAEWFQGHWWGFISRNYVVWPIFLLMNVFIALKGSHFWFLFKLAWFVPLLAFCRQTNEKSSLPVLHYEIIMRFCNVSDTFLILMTFLWCCNVSDTFLILMTFLWCCNISDNF